LSPLSCPPPSPFLAPFSACNVVSWMSKSYPVSSEAISITVLIPTPSKRRTLLAYTWKAVQSVKCCPFCL
jgi:hypothetical protein